MPAAVAGYTGCKKDEPPPPLPSAAPAAVPAQRTLYMLTVAAIGLWLGRPGTASVVWLWALAVVLAWDPWAGLTPGFWLSFGAVGLLLYIGVGQTYDTGPYRDPAAGANDDLLITDSTLAIDPDTGKLKWHYQFTPHDTHDWDANETMVLFDAAVGGRPRKLLSQANQIGRAHV